MAGSSKKASFSDQGCSLTRCPRSKCRCRLPQKRAALFSDGTVATTPEMRKLIREVLGNPGQGRLDRRTGVLSLSSMLCSKVKITDQIEGCASGNPELIADIRYLSIGSLGARLGHFGCYDASFAGISQTVGNEKRVAAKLGDLDVVKIRSVAFLCDLGHKRGRCFFGEVEGLLCVGLLYPIRQEILFRPKFLVNLGRYLDSVRCTHVLQPNPELRNSIDRIVVSVRVNQDVGIEKIEQREDLPVCY